MDRLTAIRTFGDPSYCPARSVRIYNNRWYMVKLRDVEDRIDGYHGLADTSTVELLPGSEAREYRDCPLNRCDAIAEYRGPVYAVRWLEYGLENSERTRYVTTLEEAERLREVVEEERKQHITSLEKSRDRYMRSAEREGDKVIVLNTGPISARDLYTQWANECSEAIERAKVTDWRFTVERIR